MTDTPEHNKGKIEELSSAVQRLANALESTNLRIHSLEAGANQASQQPLPSSKHGQQHSPDPLPQVE
jgi:prefoldin subunit 5